MFRRNCLDDDEFREYNLGLTKDAMEKIRISKHLDECPECKARSIGFIKQRLFFQAFGEGAIAQV